MSRELTFIPASDIKSRTTPVCEACGLRMWWHGSTIGYGCPNISASAARKTGCRSALYRPKSDPSKPWRHTDRYPELH
jgi:tRNA(Ile2) C34 agmatinyltransferase TiaS